MAAENNPIKYSDLIAPDDSLDNLVKKLDAISDALQFVQKSAVTLNASMKDMSGATEGGRSAIAEASKEAEKLAKAQQELAFAQSETAKKIAELKEATREQNALNKLSAKEANAAKDSYNALSAQYSKLKMVLNQMSEEERKNTKAGQEMEKEAAKIYERMNELQKATGKYTLQVGNYELASKSLKKELRELTEQLAEMKLRGEDNTEQYAEMIARAGELRDAMGDATDAINNTASDTSNLDAVLGAASAVTGGFGLATSAMSILGFNTESVEKAQKKLQEAIALVNSVQAIANALNRDSALMTKLHAVAQKLLNKTMTEGAVATNAATAATKKWKIALMTTGIGIFLVALGSAVALLSDYYERTNEAKVAQDNFNKSLEGVDKAAEKASKAYQRMKNEMSASGASEIELAEAEANNAREQLKFAEKALELARKRKKDFGSFVLVEGDTSDKAEQYRDILKSIQDAQEKYNDAYSAKQVALFNLDKAMTTEYENNKKKQADADKKAAEEAKKAEEERKKAAEEAFNNEQQRMNEKVSLLRSEAQNIEDNGELYKKQLEIAEAQYTADLHAAKDNYNQKMIAYNNYLNAIQTADDARSKYLDEQVQKENEREKQRLIELVENAYAERNLEIEQMKVTEKTKTRLRLQAELDYQKKRQELVNKKVLEMSDAEISLTITKLQNELAESGGSEVRSVYDLLGLNFSSEQEKVVNDAFKTAISNVNAYIDSLVQLKEKAVETANTRVDSAKKALEAEIEARNNGYANNVEMAQKELDLARKNQQKAIQDAEKAKKAQVLIDTAEQTSSLVTATANIWKAFASQPAVAIAMTALMWTSFAAAKAKAFQVAGNSGEEKYGDGTVELLAGGSHQSGNDIDLGRKSDGTRRRAEGGEFFAVINKRNSRKYRKVIPDVIRSLNNDTFANKYLEASARMNGAIINVSNNNSTDIRQLQSDVRAIKKAGEISTYVDARGYFVEKSKGYTRIIRR